MVAEKKFLDNLLRQCKAERRVPINLLMDQKVIEEADEVLEIISTKEGKYYSRNALFDVAVKTYLKGLKENISSSYADLKKDIKEEIIIFTSDNIGGEYDNWYKADYWKAVSLSEVRVNLIKEGEIKYFALYRGKGKNRKSQNLQNIIEYSEIASINYISAGKDAGKYEFFLSNRKALQTPITSGSVNPMSLQRGRITSLQKFLQAKTLNDLF